MGILPEDVFSVKKIIQTEYSNFFLISIFSGKVRWNAALHGLIKNQKSMISIFLILW